MIDDAVGIFQSEQGQIQGGSKRKGSKMKRCRTKRLIKRKDKDWDDLGWMTA